MSFLKSLTRVATEERAAQAEAKALTAQAELDATRRALDELTRAVGMCKMTTIVGQAHRHIRPDGDLWVRAPHDQDPRVQQALTKARDILGRAL